MDDGDLLWRLHWMGADWMAHLWDNVALWVALHRLRMWQDLHAAQQRNTN